MVKFTVTQAERIGELNGTAEDINMEFETTEERGSGFQKDGKGNGP